VPAVTNAINSDGDGYDGLWPGEQNRKKEAIAMLRVFIFDKEGNFVGRDWIELSPKGGWVTKGRFKLVEKGFTPVEGILRYDAIIVKEIIDRRGKKVPILRLKPHVCRGKCEERCPMCEEWILHEFDVIDTKKTEDYCIWQKVRCRKCGFEKVEMQTHDFVLRSKAEGLLCKQCGYRREVRDVKEIKEYAVPPYPLEEVLVLYDLTIKKILDLDRKITILYTPVVSKLHEMHSALDEKLRRSRDFHWGTSFSNYSAFLEKVGIFIKRDVERIWVRGKCIYGSVSNDSTLMGEVTRTYYMSFVLKEFASERELLETLDIYPEDETRRLYEEYLRNYERASFEYDELNRKFEEEIAKDEVYKNLCSFLKSRYGQKLCYAADPHEGYFRGTAIPMHAITQVFLKAIDILGLSQVNQR